MTLMVELTVPDVIDVDAIFADLIKVMDREIDAAEKLFFKTYHNWSAKSKPSWETEKGVMTKLSRGDLIYLYSTRDFPYVWVSAGTVGGRVSFSKNYRPMTTPRRLGSGRRQGRVLRRGRGAPIISGIKPREFEFAVRDLRQPIFARKAQRAVLSGTRKWIRGDKRLRLV